MDGFTYEEFEPEELTFVMILLPPLVFEGITLKGLYTAPGVDAIHLLLPRVSEHFISIANSRWAGYPWSSHADGYFVCYNNHGRINYFKNKPSSRKDITLIAQQTADHVNECEYYPRGEIQKDIDILVVARVDSTKNLGSLAQAIAALHKMGRRHHVVWAQAESLQDAWARPNGRQLLTEMERHLGRLEDHLEPRGAVSNAEMRLLFARAKVFFLPSLVEGKSRARAEALCSNVPVVAFNSFNLAARGDEPVLPERAGLAVDLDPQDAARGLANAVANYGDFTPRESYLRTGGRLNFFWECLFSFKYFCDQIPGNTAIEQANWLNRAMISNYGLSLIDFLYHDHSANPFAKKNRLKSLGHAAGAIEIENLFMPYLTRFSSHTSR